VRTTGIIKNGVMFERYIKSIRVANETFTVGVGDQHVSKISVRDEANLPFKVIVDFKDGTSVVFMNHPAVVDYFLRKTCD